MKVSCTRQLRARWEGLAEDNWRCDRRRDRAEENCLVWGVCFLRVRKVIPSLLGEGGSYIPDVDAGVEAKLVDCGNVTICMC